MARGRKPFQTIENLLKNYQIDNNGCWIWQRTLNNWGYGQFTFKHKSYLAHRASYIFHKGEIPEGLMLDHLCRVPACINPAHLEPVTPYENYIRGVSPTANVVHSNVCGRGHELTEDNVYKARSGWRRCRKCVAINQENNKIQITCLNCKKVKRVRRNTRAENKFCSKECYWKYKALKGHSSR